MTEQETWIEAIRIASGARQGIYADPSASQAARAMQQTIIRHLLEAARVRRLEQRQKDQANA